jgi:hypothetical protein
MMHAYSSITILLASLSGKYILFRYVRLLTANIYYSGMYVLFYSEYILFSYTRSVLRCKHTYFFKYISFPVLLLLMAASNISTTIILFSSEDRSVGFTFNSPLTAAFK